MVEHSVRRTIGHASVIEAVLRLFPCDEIWVMPSADRHDKVISAPAEHRIKMLKIMTEDYFSDSKIPIKISRLEVDRNKPTTTFDTMNELKSKYPDFEFHFVVDLDQLGQI